MENITALGSRQAFKPIDKFCKKLVLGAFERLENAGLWLKDAQGMQFFGDGKAALQATMTVTDPKTYKLFVQGGSVGAGEAYIAGYWQADDLTRLIEIFALNQARLDAFERRFAPVAALFHKWKHLKNRNSKSGSKRNILAHYDLGNDLYSAFLSPEMLYSSAIYPHPDASLSEAQQHKLEVICKRLALKADDHLLEIGTGWGALAVYAAQKYGCRVTTTTISDAQYEYARELVERNGLGDRITLLKTDYRDLEGQYDKLVSIEMIEAVGHQYLGGFFAKCRSLLKDDGLMLLQAITIADQRYAHYLRRSDFIQQYIFPGGCLPSLSEMSARLRDNTDLVIDGISDIGLHYARTLFDWRKQFVAAWPTLEKGAFDARFFRLWTYYLSYCEGAFRQRAISTVHLVARTPRYRGDDEIMALDY